MSRLVVVLASLAACVGIYFAAVFPELDEDSTQDEAVDEPVAARDVVLAPDGEIYVSDAGSGANDGRIWRFDIESGDWEAVRENLPSELDSRQLLGGITGPAGVAAGQEDRVCVVVGGFEDAGLPFRTLRCTDGGVFELDPEAVGNPFGLTADEEGGWYIADPDGERILHMAATGEVTTVLDFAALLTDAGEDAPPLPQGPVALAVSDGGRMAIALLSGLVAEVDVAALPAVTLDDVVFERGDRPADVLFVGESLHVLNKGESRGDGHITAGTLTIAEGLDEPLSFVHLGDGRFAVVEAGGLRFVVPSIEREPPGTGGGAR